MSLARLSSLPTWNVDSLPESMTSWQCKQSVQIQLPDLTQGESPHFRLEVSLVLQMTLASNVVVYLCRSYDHNVILHPVTLQCVLHKFCVILFTNPVWFCSQIYIQGILLAREKLLPLGWQYRTLVWRLSRCTSREEWMVVMCYSQEENFLLEYHSVQMRLVANLISNKYAPWWQLNIHTINEFV